MYYRATITPLVEYRRQVGKEVTRYTNAPSEAQAGRFLRIRYPYPKYVVENVVPDPREEKKLVERPQLSENPGKPVSEAQGIITKDELTALCSFIAENKSVLVDLINQDDKERAIVICEGKEKDWYMSAPCIGEECYVQLPTCEQKTVASFHTHPTYLAEIKEFSEYLAGIASHFSGFDILEYLNKGQKISCIGYKNMEKNPEIKCYMFDEKARDKATDKDLAELNKSLVRMKLAQKALKLPLPEKITTEYIDQEGALYNILDKETDKFEQVGKKIGYIKECKI